MKSKTLNHLPEWELGYIISVSFINDAEHCGGVYWLRGLGDEMIATQIWEF